MKKFIAVLSIIIVVLLGVFFYKYMGAINNSGGTTINDSTGLVSATNFPNNGTVVSGIITTQSTSYTDVSGATVNFTLSRNANVLFLISVDNFAVGSTNSNTSYIYLALNIDGSVVYYIYHLNYDTTKTASVTSGGDGSFSWIALLGAGNHTAKLQWKVANVGSGDGSMDIRTLNYIILGT